MKFVFNRKEDVQEDPLHEGRISSFFLRKSQSADGRFSLTWQKSRQAASCPPLETNVSSADSQTHTHIHTMLHAKASVEKGEYQLSIKYMLSFPDAVRLQVISFTFERFPITNACAPLITTHQQGRGKPLNSCSTFRGNRTKGINDWPWSQDINLGGTDFCSQIEQLLVLFLNFHCGNS